MYAIKHKPTGHYYAGTYIQRCGLPTETKSWPLHVEDLNQNDADRDNATLYGSREQAKEDWQGLQDSSLFAYDWMDGDATKTCDGAEYEVVTL